MRIDQDYRPVLESLEPRLMLSLTPELAALLTPAQVLKLQPLRSVSANGIIASPDQGRDYSFTATASGQVTATSTSWAWLMKPGLGVFDGDGDLLGQTSSAAKSSTATISFVAIKGQTYYLQTTSANGGVGRFNIRVVSNTADEYGDTFDTAKTVTLSKNGAGSINGGIQFAADVDMFRVVATKTGTLSAGLAVNGWRNSLSGELTAYDADGNVLAHDDNAANQAAATSFAVTAGQVYYVKVGGLAGTVGTYRLSLATAAPPPPPPDADAYADTHADAYAYAHADTYTHADPTPTPTPDPTPTPTPTPTPDPSPSYTPGATVTGQIVQGTGGTQLVVLGTDGADTITLDADRHRPHADHAVRHQHL